MPVGATGSTHGSSFTAIRFLNNGQPGGFLWRPPGTLQGGNMQRFATVFTLSILSVILIAGMVNLADAHHYGLDSSNSTVLPSVSGDKLDFGGGEFDSVTIFKNTTTTGAETHQGTETHKGTATYGNTTTLVINNGKVTSNKQISIQSPLVFGTSTTSTTDGNGAYTKLIVKNKSGVKKKVIITALGNFSAVAP